MRDRYICVFSFLIEEHYLTIAPPAPTKKRKEKNLFGVPFIATLHVQ